MTTLTFSEDLLQATASLNQQELAVALYQRETLTIEQAAHLAKMDRTAFQRLLASRDLYLTLDVDDLEQDLATLRALGRL
jgi:predicted HTH domain antitoxin